jgi:hypothetical protein
MVGGMARLRVLSKNGQPGAEFVLSNAVLEDYYFELVNQPK